MILVFLRLVNETVYKNPRRHSVIGEESHLHPNSVILSVSEESYFPYF